MNHIVIIGFMGSGKTRVGKRLSKDLGLPFIDVDKVVTKKMDMSAKEIFQRFGEPYYRALETMTIKGLIEDKEQKVISLGAGLPIQEQNQKYLKELGCIVYLKGSSEVLARRIEESGSSNPLLEGENREEKLKKLLKQRDPIYARYADIQVVTGVKPFDSLVAEIEEKLGSYLKIKTAEFPKEKRQTEKRHIEKKHIEKNAGIPKKMVEKNTGVL